MEEKLFNKKEVGWSSIDTREKEAIYSYCNNYMNFMNKSKTEREAVVTAKAIAEANGFRDLASYETLNPGDKVYFIDTTWMAPQKITPKNSSTFNSLSHKLEIKKRSRTTIKKTVTTNINTYYFLFTPQDEVRTHKQQHFPTND